MKKFGYYFFNRGFTLMELMIVVAIVGITATGSFIGIKSSIDKGWDKQKKDHLSRLKIAIEEYYTDNENCYPPGNIFSAHDPSCGEGADQLQPYLRIVPCDPSTNTYYIYQKEGGPSCSQWFKIFTNLQNTSDPIIDEVGCRSGCGPSPHYNFGVSSSNVSLN